MRLNRLSPIMLLAGLPVLAGPLTPPPGPVASTMKTIEEAEPRTIINTANTPGDADSIYKITQPGSYYLTGNIIGVSGRHCLEVASDNVTIDLRGFTISGVAGSLDGIAVTARSNNITIRDGVVTACRNGIVLLPIISTFTSEGSLIERMHVSDCVASGQLDGAGIRADRSAVLRDCTATNNEHGISTSFNAAITSCSAMRNAGEGIRIGEGSSAVGCSAYLNMYGISAGSGSSLINCSAFDNTRDGLRGDYGTTFTGCSSFRNGALGILAGSGSTLTGCSMRENAGGGLARGTGSAGAGFTVTGCSAQGNGSHGFSLPDGSTIVNCSSQINNGDGIRIANDTTVRDCTIDHAAAAGIHATGADNRIESNNCTDSARGMDIDGQGNIIVRNTCSGNATNWEVINGNVCLVVVGTPAGVILGDSGGAAPGSTDPNANFTY